MALWRREKLDQLLREELAALIDREIEFPDGVLVTITRVEVSPDIHYAKVYFSVMGDTGDSVMELLQKNIYTLQQMVNKRIQRRPVPRIRFEIDEGEMRREEIEKTMIEIKKRKEL